MRSNTARAIAGLAVVALAIVLFIVFQGGDDDEGTSSQTTNEQPAEPQNGGDQQTPEPTPPAEPVEQTITIKDGAPVGGIAEIEATSGETVKFMVVSDEAGEVHVHGYEIEKPIEPNKPLLVSFGANIEGAFEVELHGESSEFQIADLSVNPG
jgi:hypothetical protein